MVLGKKDIFTPSKPTKEKKSISAPRATAIKKSIDTYKRQTYYLKLSLIEKVVDYAYWERLKISEVVNIALEKYLKDKKFKSRK